MFPPDIDTITRRHEAWWQMSIIDRPLIQVTAPRTHLPTPELSADEAYAWFTDPAIVAARLEREVQNTYCAGDAVPVVFPCSISLVAITAAYLGCPYHIHPYSMTAWADPIIKNWDARRPIAFERSNEWWQMSERLFDAVGRQAQGRYFIGMPDLNAPGEVVARLRGTTELAFDCVEHPDEVRAACREADAAWLEIWQAASALVKRWQDTSMFWLGLCSSKPATDLQCDFSAMISPAMFNDFFLPGIEQQTRWVERTIYHLDGPEAIRHLDALLDLPRLTAIQWVPGAGKPPALHWLPLLKRIQAAGKGIWVQALAEEVETLLAELKPEGLLLRVSCETPAEADALMAQVERWTRTRRKP
jgi:hypothetical protein